MDETVEFELGMKYDRVLEEMRISLERLQMSSVDILYLHAPDHNTPIEETLSAVQKLYEGNITTKFVQLICKRLV